MRARRDRDALLLAAGELEREARPLPASPTRSSSSSPRRLADPARAPPARAGADELARRQLGGERACVVLVGVAEHAVRYAATPRRQLAMSSRTRGRCLPTGGRGRRECRRSVDLPEPLGPRTLTTSSSGRSAKGLAALPRRPRASGGPGTDRERTTALSCARPPRSGRRRRRGTRPRRGRDERGADARVERKPERQTAGRAELDGGCAPPPRSTRPREDQRERRRLSRSRRRRRRGTTASVRSRRWRRSSRGLGSLRLEVEQVAALVADVGRRRRARCRRGRAGAPRAPCRRARAGTPRASGSSARPRLDSGARLHVDDVERAHQLAVPCRAQISRGDRGPGTLGVHGRSRAVCTVGDHEVAVDRGEAVRDPDDARQQRRALDLHRKQGRSAPAADATAGETITGTAFPSSGVADPEGRLQVGGGQEFRCAVFPAAVAFTPSALPRAVVDRERLAVDARARTVSLRVPRGCAPSPVIRLALEAAAGDVERVAEQPRSARPSGRQPDGPETAVAGLDAGRGRGRGLVGAERERQPARAAAARLGAVDVRRRGEGRPASC